MVQANNISRKVAREDGNQLDKKQIITYKAICATFLLGLIYDSEDKNTPLGKYLAQALNSSNSSDRNVTDN